MSERTTSAATLEAKAPPATLSSALLEPLRKPRRLQRGLVAFVVLHSYAVMLVLLMAPGYMLELGGFETGGSTFFVRQGGVFHGVVATGYLLEYRALDSTVFATFTKLAATAFLVASWLWLYDAPAILLAAIGDGAMGLALAVVGHRVRQVGRGARE